MPGKYHSFVAIGYSLGNNLMIFFQYSFVLWWYLYSITIVQCGICRKTCKKKVDCTYSYSSLCAGTAGCITSRTAPQWKSPQKKRSSFRPTRRISQERNTSTSLIVLPDQKLNLGSLLRFLDNPWLVNSVCMLYTSGAGIYWPAIVQTC